jgi:FtsZ-interacting cell division protein ZipA
MDIVVGIIIAIVILGVIGNYKEKSSTTRSSTSTNTSSESFVKGYFDKNGKFISSHFRKNRKKKY